MLWLLGEPEGGHWGSVIFLALLLFALEALFSFFDFGQRRLKRLAPDCFPLKNLGEDDRRFVQSALATAPRKIFWRSTSVWVLAFFFSAAAYVLGGPRYSEALLVSLGLPVAALTATWGTEVLLKRVLPFFYFEGDYAKSLGQWLPTLDKRLRGHLLAPVGVMLAPLAAAFILAQPLSLASLLWIAAWGALLALGAAWALSTLVTEPMDTLREALRRSGQGELNALLDVTSGDELGHATETYNKSMRAFDRRLFILENFGHSVAPGKSDAIFDKGLRLDGEKRQVALLECRWHNTGPALRGQEAPAQLNTLNRFYEAVQDAVDKAQGAVLHVSEGRVLAIWGAPLDDEQPVQGALAAAWSLQAHLKVWSNQQRLRGTEAPQWGLAVASGQATLGLLGPRNRQRYSVLGGPVDEVQALAARQEGPWLDERSAGAAKSPFAAQISSEGARLIAGPEPEAPSASDLGFAPGERL